MSQPNNLPSGYTFYPNPNNTQQYPFSMYVVPQQPTLQTATPTIAPNPIPTPIPAPVAPITNPQTTPTTELTHDNSQTTCFPKHYGFCPECNAHCVPHTVSANNKNSHGGWVYMACPTCSGKKAFVEWIFKGSQGPITMV
jgi:hypothetical protein